jgi:hypothetical protein
MTTKIPIRTVYDEQNDPVGLAEFQVGEYLGIDYGGTGGNTVTSARVALSVDNANIRSLFSVTGGGSYDNSTGVINIIATDLSPYALKANNLSVFASTTSAQLASIISDGTGSGNLVFATSPTLVTPNLGTPSAIVLTNATGTAANLTANIANFISVSDDTSTNGTRFPVFVNGTSGAVADQVSSTKFTFNPSSGLLTTTDYNSSSDKRLKKEIKTIDNALEKITQLRGVTFTWKESEQKAVGLIAQEVQKIIPEIVNTDELGYLGIRYTNLIGVLIEAIKEQQDQINTLKQQIEKLNG